MKEEVSHLCIRSVLKRQILPFKYLCTRNAGVFCFVFYYPSTSNAIGFPMG